MIKSNDTDCYPFNSKHCVLQSERGLWKLDPVIRFYQKVETACYALLALSGIGAILYSVSVFLR
jgi:hypothetical protein